LGIAETVRGAGLPRTSPMDVFLADSMAAPEAIVHLPYPSVADAKATIAANNDGRPLEPYQLISQYTLEPLLRSIADTRPELTVRFSCEMTSFVEDETGIRKLRQALFYAPELYERIPMGKGRHYHIAKPPIFPFIIIQDSTKHWTLHAAAESDAEMTEIFRGALAMDVPFETLSVNEWTQHLLCADRYRAGRAFIAGDAAHLVIPTGGLGMNTGVGDAIDLSWKLAATLAGWGGPGLLDSYERERRQIGLRNVRASGAAMDGRTSWRAEPTREAMGAAFDTEQRKVTEILGIECGYRYVDSPVVWPEDGDAPDPDNRAYVPTTWPGFRLPHVWLDDGSALHDRLGFGYTLLRLGAAPPDTSALERSLRASGAPLNVVRVPDARAREIYARDLVLVRPDLHVAWRGNAPPADGDAIAAAITGRSEALAGR
jgi:hypothetical protein